MEAKLTELCFVVIIFDILPFLTSHIVEAKLARLCQLNSSTPANSAVFGHKGVN